MTFLERTLLGTVMILAVAVLRALALRRLPKGTFVALWQLTVLRLLVPAELPSRFSVYTMLEALRPKAVPVPPAAPAVTPYVPAPAAALPGPSGMMPAAPAPFPVWTALWLTGAAALGLWHLVRYVRWRRRFRESLPAGDCPAADACLRSRREIRLRVTDRIGAPLTYGVLRPVILLPKTLDLGDEEAVTCVLAHEMGHIRRLDGLFKLALAAVLCLYWFDPAVWLLYVLANRDMELSCDMRVMDTLGGGERASYALTLLDLEETRNQYFSPYSHFSKLAIEERIEAIMKYKKTSVLALSLAAALVVGATTAFAASASPLSKEQQDRQLNSESMINEGTLMSYADPKDGKTYYSFDGGKTFEAMTDEEFERRFPTPNVEWWTYEEYAAWLEQEKVNLQAMLGETGATGGRGEFVWTQEIIDETIAMYEGILQEIKEGIMYSKSVDGDENLMMSYNPADIESGTGKPVEADTIKVQAAAKVAVSDGYVFTSEKDGVPLDDWDVARAPQYTEAEWRQIMEDIESGKIPPLEIPNDPNVTVRIVNYPGGCDAAKD